MKNVLKFIGIYAVCWFVIYLILVFARRTYESAVIGAVILAVLPAAIITVVTYFMGRIEKLEFAVKRLQDRVDELEKKN